MKPYIFLIPFILQSCSEKNIQNNKPNIILINVDDMGWRDVGFMGSEYYETPNIDSLAAQSIIFTNAYSSASNCAPSRASLMSGQWSPRHGIFTVESSERGLSENRKLIPIENNTTLPENQYTLTEALKDAGYTTCHAGKWHLSDDPLRYGFDFNIGGNHSGNPGSYYPPYKNVPSLEPPSEDYYLTDLIMDKTLEFVQENTGSPFFLYYSPYAVHTPIQPIKHLLGKYENKAEWNSQNNAAYATMIENLDNQIGRLINLLKELNILEQTFILFTSDNGGHYRITRQLPLRSGKGSYYEGGIRVPLFIKWPGKILPGSISEQPVSNIDFFPTLMKVAQFEIDSDKILDGTSLMPILTKEEAFKGRPIFWHFPIYLEGYLKEGDPTQDPLFRTRPGSAIRYGDWKLIHYFENNDYELYNLANDISEENNLASTHPEKLNELKSMLENWRIITGAPIPNKLNPEYIP